MYILAGNKLKGKTDQLYELQQQLDIERKCNEELCSQVTTDVSLNVALADRLQETKDGYRRSQLALEEEKSNGHPVADTQECQKANK